MGRDVAGGSPTARWYLNPQRADLWEQPGTVGPALGQTSGDLGLVLTPGRSGQVSEPLWASTGFSMRLGLDQQPLAG